MSQNAGHWVLGFIQPSKDPKVTLNLADQRPLRPRELKVYDEALGVLDKVTASRMILPLANALKAISEARDDALAKGTQFGRKDRSKLRKDMDTFLVELVACRPRLEKFVEAAFGATAADDLRRSYQSGFDNERHYRLAWELRNLSMHGGDSIEGTRFEAALVNEEKKQELVFKIDELVAANGGDKSWKALKKLWTGIDTVPVLVAFTWAYSWAEVMYSHAVVANADRIEQAASVVMKLFLEAESPQTKPVLYAAFGQEPNPGTEQQMNISLKVIDPSWAIEARMSIERSHERVAQWQRQEAANRKPAPLNS